MAPSKDLFLLGLSVAYVAIFSALFATTGGRWLTLVLGVNVGIGLTGFLLSALKVIRPGRYRFLYEGAPGEDS